ncbi:hypothetical protein GV054_09180 [Marinomonas mediterranea]|jgi:hypothetical protein|uniref:Uncharacterized protein n=1 Tax=Marinomonas mediterranea (strain ATCC 700492 / JCM 21426 / NBRC 103028 / MMB-1) TaxID=717774 RepID=F2K228_MARM1|nr:hypothetical protein [Marinomonas mediterranea]ADZ91106.1 hypothetical protein Marme_1850 [Marinomonas mediterranea MMB-1]WCN13167.1 hypothetical protein GV054_09180 [Marinomonas mediterranea]WCN17238.1 hypothetical protein GV053_09340 [Marinomonas mediterranea MMB-1]
MAEIVEELQKLKQAAQEQTAVSQEQTSVVSGMIGEIDGRMKAAEVAVERYIDGASGNLPAVNLLLNSRATEKDSDGNYLSPIGFHSSGGAVLDDLRVLEYTDDDVPSEIKSQCHVEGGLVFNVLEVTLSAGSAGGDFLLLPGRPVRGRFTTGVLACLADKNGMFFCGQTMESNQLYVDLSMGSVRYWNIDGLVGSVSAQGVKLYIVGPWVSAGYISGSPLIVMSSSYGIGSSI